MTKRIIMGTMATLLVGMLVAQGQSGQGKRPKTLMRAKLDHSQQVLEALALEDFAGMAKHAEQMKLLSLDAGWQVLQTAEYARHSADFRRATGSLVEAADKKNLDGAVLAYFQLTQTCVQCHRHVRAEQSP